MSANCVAWMVRLYRVTQLWIENLFGQLTGNLKDLIW